MTGRPSRKRVRDAEVSIGYEDGSSADLSERGKCDGHAAHRGGWKYGVQDVGHS